MEIVKELSRIISPKRTKHVNLMDFRLKENSKLMRFYDGLRRGKFKSDEDAIMALYGTMGAKYKYSKLKYDLRKRLYNTIHLVELDAQEMGEVRKIFLECQRVWTSVYFLIFFKAQKAAIYVLEKHFPKMLEHDFTIMVLEAAKILHQHYTSLEIDPKRCEKYDKIIQDYLKLYIAETRLTVQLSNMYSYFSQSRKQHTELAPIAKAYLEEIQKIYPPIISNHFIFKYAMIELLGYMSLYDYEKTIEACWRGIEQLESKTIKYKTALLTLYMQKINCETQLMRYDIAAADCEKVFEHYVTVGDFNWYKAQSLYIQVLFYQEKYDDVYQVYLKATNYKSFSKMPSFIHEEWKIYRAYLEFLILTEKLSAAPEQELRKFRLNRFLNEMVTFSKDKQGLNISILAAQVVVLIAQENYSRVIDKMEAIEKYVRRHLNTGYHYRTKYFIKIIAAFYKAGFESNLVDWEKVQELKAQLITQPLDIINPNYDVEIIRYEVLIEILETCFSEQAVT